MERKQTLNELKEKLKQLENEITIKEKRIHELTKENTHIFQIYNESNIPTFVINAHHVITHYNKALVRLTGLAAENMIGTKDQWKAFYKRKRPVMADLLIDNASEDKIARLYKDFYKKSSAMPGSYEAEGFFEGLGEEGKWLYFTATPIKDENGNVIGAIETLQDITDRKKTEQQLRRSENRYKALLDFAPYPIVVYNTENETVYINAAFTEIFGWDISEIKGKKIPYFPSSIGNDELIGADVRDEKKKLKRHLTKRLTKSGNVIDVVLRAATLFRSENEPAGKMVIFRDITNERRVSRNIDAMLRISLSLPGFRFLDKLLDYISKEIRELLDTEGALVGLLDEDTGEVYFPGVDYDDANTTRKVKKSRFPLDHLIAGKVIKIGEPIIINDTTEDGRSFPERDLKFGYLTRNIIEVPLKGKTRIFGILAGMNKKEGDFGQTDIELLNMIAGTVSLSIENARYSDDLKKAFQDVKDLNRAKDKAINHLSHELRTPVSTLSGVLELLEHELKEVPKDNWENTMAIAKRNLHRIVEIQAAVSDIMHGNKERALGLIDILFNQCVDVLEKLIENEIKDTGLIKKAREQVEHYFGLVEEPYHKIYLDNFVEERIAFAKQSSTDRNVNIISTLEPVNYFMMPEDSMRKIVDGLLKNAIENTPDEGRIEVMVKKIHERVELTVQDFGVGIIEEDQKRIFDGFFATQNTMFYSTKTPYAFNAGGKGAELLRMKIFSEKYGFEIDMSSKRCRHIPLEKNICPGKISKCSHCKDLDDCFKEGGTVFSLLF